MTTVNNYHVTFLRGEGKKKELKKVIEEFGSDLDIEIVSSTVRGEWRTVDLHITGLTNDIHEFIEELKLHGVLRND